MRGEGGSRWERKGEPGKIDESVQCSPTGSVYKRTELLSVAVLCTVMPLWGCRLTSVWMGCCLTIRQFKPVGMRIQAGQNFV